MFTMNNGLELRLLREKNKKRWVMFVFSSGSIRRVLDCALSDILAKWCSR